MADESILAGLATELSAAAAVEALNLIYAREATLATATAQATGNASLSSLDAKTPALSSGRVPVELPAATVTALTPPAAITGFSTAAKQDTGNTSLGSIDTKTPALSAGRVPVELPTATVTALTPPAAITGFSTSAGQSTGNGSLASIDSKTPNLSSGRTPVELPAATVTALTPPAAISGFATSALQAPGNASLSSIDSKTPTLSSGRTPVELPAATVTTLTPPAAITGYATSAKQDVDHADWIGGVMGIRRDVDTSPVSDGQTHPLSTNQNGRLKVSNTPGAYALTTGSIVAATTVIGPVDVSRASNVVVDLASGTFAGINATFETSQDGGSTWKSELLLRSNGLGIQESTTGLLAAAPAYRWEASVNGLSLFRVRAIAWTSGAAVFNISLGADATEPFVTVAPHAISGTVTTSLASTTITSLVPGVAATSLGKAEDAPHASGDTGSAVWTVRNDNAATTPASANGDYQQFSSDDRGAVFTRERSVTSTGPTSVATSTTAATVAANAARRGGSVKNLSSAVLYVSLGGTATSSLFTADIAVGGYYEIPLGYAGSMSLLLASGTGAALVTELI